MKAGPRLVRGLAGTVVLTALDAAVALCPAGGWLCLLGNLCGALLCVLAFRLWRLREPAVRAEALAVGVALIAGFYWWLTFPVLEAFDAICAAVPDEKEKKGRKIK